MQQAKPQQAVGSWTISLVEEENGFSATVFDAPFGRWQKTYVATTPEAVLDLAKQAVLSELEKK
jgi:hypothetical protein